MTTDKQKEEMLEETKEMIRDQVSISLDGLVEAKKVEKGYVAEKDDEEEEDPDVDATTNTGDDEDDDDDDK